MIPKVNAYIKKHKVKCQPITEGITMEHLEVLEKVCNVSINVYSRNAKLISHYRSVHLKPNQVVLLYRGQLTIDDTIQTIYLDVSQLNRNKRITHCSVIYDMIKYSKHFRCHTCNYYCTTHRDLIKHQHRCQGKVIRKYKCGPYYPKENIIEELKNYGIYINDTVKESLSRVICYDYESLLMPIEEEPRPMDRYVGPKNAYSRHIPVSFSVHSQVLENPLFILSNGSTQQDVRELLDKFVQELIKLSEIIYLDLKEKCQYIFDELEARAKQEMEIGLKKSYYKTLISKLNNYIQATPVTGYNSAKYDLNLVKAELVEALKKYTTIQGVIRRQTSYTSIRCKDLQFLDVINYIAPGFSLAKYVSCYADEGHAKGHFCYEHLTSYDKLFDEQLPDITAFSSKLKGTKMSPQEYEECQKIWTSHNMKYLHEFLRFYNNNDVKIFLAAIKNHQQFYINEFEIYLFRDAITIPAIATKVCWSYKPREMESIFMPSEKVYDILQRGIIGGQCLCYGRKFEPGVPLSNRHTVTHISTISKDANALYLSQTGSYLPTGPAIVRDAPYFKPDLEYKQYQYSKESQRWLFYCEHKLGHKIIRGDKEMTIANRKVDGLLFTESTKMVFSYLGCFWHSHVTHRDEYNPMDKHKTKQITHKDNYEQTMQFIQTLKRLNYTVEVIWECEWQRKCQEPEVQQILVELPIPYKPCGGITSEEKLLKAVREGKIRGFMQADIMTPDHLKEKYRNLEPVFKRTAISQSTLKGVMLEYAKTHKLLKQPQEMIVSSYFANNYVALSELFKYYMEIGLIVSNVHHFIEYEHQPLFKNFADIVTNKRREATADPRLKIIADTYKLLGNIPYGKSISNVSKYRKVCFASRKEAEKLISRDGYLQLTQLSADLYEVES